MRVNKVCLNCKNKFTVIPSRADKAKYCCRECYYMGSRGAKRKERVISEYKRFNVDGENALYHRHIMEKHLGRKLKRDEYVHHINEDKQDNRLENLQVMSPDEHNKHHLQKYPLTKICVICGEEFTPLPTKRSRNKICSSEECWKEIVNIENAKKKRAIIQLDLGNNFIKEWCSGTEVQNELGFAHGNIVKCCKHQNKTAYGYKWVYKDEYIVK